MQMRWCLITHADLSGAPPTPVAEEAFVGYYEPRGWIRTSGWTTDPHTPANDWPRHENDPEPVVEAETTKTTAPKKVAVKDEEH